MKNKMQISHCHGNEHRTMGPFPNLVQMLPGQPLGAGEDDCLHVPNS